jgi:hypothetical protein
MAYLYRKHRSPFWYIQYIDADKIKHDKSTGFRADDPNDTIKAKVLRAELEAREYQRVPMVNGAAWDYWVPKFFERHCPTKATLDRYEDAWKWVALWLQNNRIHSPRQLTYRLGIAYLDWRTTFKKRTGKIVGRNTAILELKLFSLVMGEAVRMGHAAANPLVSMKIRRDKAPKKPELTDDEILEIQEALRDEPEWMQVSFEIGLHTGCRLRETRIPLSCVDFRESKGRRRHTAATMLPVRRSVHSPFLRTRVAANDCNWRSASVTAWSWASTIRGLSPTNAAMETDLAGENVKS